MAASMLMPLSACSTKNDETVLNIVCLNQGYGDQWIKTIAQKFEEENPGYTVNLDNVTPNAATLINSHIYSKKNTDDLYISVSSSWKAYASAGKFASLDDLLTDTVDGVTVKEKIVSEYQNSVYYPDSDTGELHTYRLPWTAGFGGIYYNQKMFDDYGWNVPETYDELVTLCNTIVEANIAVEGASNDESIKPFVYTGENTDYFDYTVFTWWAQLTGKTNIEEFLQYKNADSFNTSKNSTYQALKTATQMWSDLFTNSAYVMDGCSGMSNHTAQTAFVNGYAAMMFNGDWLYNETLGYGITNSKFELSVMKTPTAPNAVATDITYTVGEDQYIAIPATSIKQDLAKKFIKLIISDYGCQVFAEQAHGLLAYSGALKATTTDPFMSKLLSVRSSYATAFTDYPTISSGENLKSSTKQLYFSDKINIWGTSALRPFANILGGTRTVDTAFTTIASTMSSQWSDFKTQIGLN
jgi:ABC-type glycerol-3-phosphate transport system substrate-binding protein